MSLVLPTSWLQILTSPPILLCDEPTSGLDSFLALQVVTVFWLNLNTFFIVQCFFIIRIFNLKVPSIETKIINCKIFLCFLRSRLCNERFEAEILTRELFKFTRFSKRVYGVNFFEVLKRLASRKRMTIVVTIHQPSSQVFQLFDRWVFRTGKNEHKTFKKFWTQKEKACWRIYLMAEGTTAFCGTPSDANKFFEEWVSGILAW